jgi:hypothetical protein
LISRYGMPQITDMAAKAAHPRALTGYARARAASAISSTQSPSGSAVESSTRW